MNREHKRILREADNTKRQVDRLNTFVGCTDCYCLPESSILEQLRALCNYLGVEIKKEYTTTTVRAIKKNPRKKGDE